MSERTEICCSNHYLQFAGKCSDVCVICDQRKRIAELERQHAVRDELRRKLIEENVKLEAIIERVCELPDKWGDFAANYSLPQAIRELKEALGDKV